MHRSSSSRFCSWVDCIFNVRWHKPVSPGQCRVQQTHGLSLYEEDAHKTLHNENTSADNETSYHFKSVARLAARGHVGVWGCKRWLDGGLRWRGCWETWRSWNGKMRIDVRMKEPLNDRHVQKKNLILPLTFFLASLCRTWLACLRSTLNLYKMKRSSRWMR